MKTKHYLKVLIPLSLIMVIFRAIEIMFAIEPNTGFYVLGSIIPIIFNIFAFIGIIFFMSVVFLTPKETKTVRIRVSTFTKTDNAIFFVAAILILTISMRDVLFKFFQDSSDFHYTTTMSIFQDIDIYIMILAFLSSLFLITLVTNPKKAYKSPIILLLSLSFPFYYVLKLFKVFTDVDSLLSKAYSSFTILYMSFLVLALINFSKFLVGSLSKRFVLGFGWCAFFLVMLRLTDFVLMLFPNNPYNISMDGISFVSDLVNCLLMLLITAKLTKKVKSTKKSTESVIDENESNEPESEPEIIV